MNDRNYVYIRDRPIKHATAVRDWVCGTCESKLKTIWDEGFKTVCSKDASHPTDGFIHYGTLERRIYTETTFGTNLERGMNMPLKDRDTAFGVPKRLRLSRIGRIRQGIMAENKQGKKYPKAIDYFIIDPLTDNAEEKARIITEVREVLAALVPNQDLNNPTVIPIVFLANSDEMIGAESYKLRKGRMGTVWCAGDGEYINWKLDDDFRVEITSSSGELVPCPGSSKEGRHDWCEKCKGEIEVSFAIRGYESTGVWMLRTSDMLFRDQFWTEVNVVRALADRGIIPGFVGVPFLLQRHNQSRLAPVGEDGSLMTLEMPTTTLRVDPNWFREIMSKNPRLEASQWQPLAISPPVEQPVEIALPVMEAGVIDADYTPTVMSLQDAMNVVTRKGKSLREAVESGRKDVLEFLASEVSYDESEAAQMILDNWDSAVEAVQPEPEEEGEYPPF